MASQLDGPPNREKKHKIALDVHAHLIPVREQSLAQQQGVSWDGNILTIDGHAIGAKGLFHPEQLLAWMNDHGVGHAWVSIPPPAYRQHLHEDAARSWLQYLDDGLVEVCSQYPERLTPLHYLPLEHPGLALDVAIAIIQKLQSPSSSVQQRNSQQRDTPQSCTQPARARFCLAAGGNKRIVFSKPQLEPLWSVLNDAGSFVFVHPGHCCDERLNAFYLENLVGNPHETAVAVSHLAFGGVCDRYRNIRFCLAHGGGTVPMLAGRLSRGYQARRPGIDTENISPPADSLKRFMADCIVHDPNALALAASVFGPDHIVFGSDWPFPMGVLQPAQQLDGVSTDLKEKVLRGNASSLL